MPDTTTTPTDRVFVYGTLRRGGSNHHLLSRARLLGSHRTGAGYTLFDTGPFPAAVARGRDCLVGEVYAVDTATMRALDRLEDFPRSYTRRPLDTPFGAAWIYLWRRHVPLHWPRLDGDWLARPGGGP